MDGRDGMGSPEGVSAARNTPFGVEKKEREKSGAMVRMSGPHVGGLSKTQTGEYPDRVPDEQLRECD